MTVTFESYTADESQQFNVTVEFSGDFTVTPPPVALPPGLTDAHVSLLRVSPVMPNPSLDANHQPINWDSTSDNISTWGRLQIIAGGKDVTYFRGAPSLPMQYGNQEPFGDDVMVVRFPQITSFDALGTGTLSWLDAGENIELKLIRPSGAIVVLWTGVIMSTEGHHDETSNYVDLHCQGGLFTIDNGLRQPSFDYRPYDIGTRIAEALNNYAGRTHSRCEPVATGIMTRSRGGWTPVTTGYVQDLLGTATTADGANQWTVAQRHRTPVIKLKDRTTVHFTLSTGTPGLSIDLAKDLTGAPNVIYGEGISPDGQHWRNTKYPNFHPDTTPAYPLSTGSVFSPGSGTSGFQEFADELRRNGYNTIVSSDTYKSADVDEVKDAQKRAGITVDGIVGAQTWNAIFQTGSNTGDLSGSYFAPLAYDPRVEAYLYNVRGAKIGKNPLFDPTVPRIERFENFGEGITKQEAVVSARAELARVSSPGWSGSATLRIDPEEMSRFEIRAGMNGRLKNWHGGNPLLHVASVEVDLPNLAVTLGWDTHARDALTLAAIRERNTDAATDPVRRSLPQRRRSRQVQDSRIIWDAESGAGIIAPMNLQGGFWTVARFPAGQVGQVNRTVMTTTSPASKFVAAIFGKPVTAANMIHLVSSNPLGVEDPWSDYSDALVDAGFLIGWGDKNSAMGYYPKTQDQTGATITGRFDEQSSWPFESQRPPWLWVAIYSNTSCKVSGHLYAEPDA